VCVCVFLVHKDWFHYITEHARLLVVQAEQWIWFVWLSAYVYVCCRMQSINSGCVKGPRMEQCRGIIAGTVVVQIRKYIKFSFSMSVICCWIFRALATLPFHLLSVHDFLCLFTLLFPSLPTLYFLVTSIEGLSQLNSGKWNEMRAMAPNFFVIQRPHLSNSFAEACFSNLEYL